MDGGSQRSAYRYGNAGCACSGCWCIGQHVSWYFRAQLLNKNGFAGDYVRIRFSCEDIFVIRTGGAPFADKVIVPFLTQQQQVGGGPDASVHDEKGALVLGAEILLLCF